MKPAMKLLYRPVVFRATRLALFILSLTGCAGVSFRVQTAAVCGSVQNDAQADCPDVLHNVAIAAEMFGPGADRVLNASHIRIVNARYLYLNAAYVQVAGTTQCVDGRPVITLDRTMRGLLHEMFHAADCLDGKPAGHDWSAERLRQGEAYMSRILPPRRVWNAYEVAEQRAAVAAEGMVLR